MIEVYDFVAGSSVYVLKYSHFHKALSIICLQILNFARLF